MSLPAIYSVFVHEKPKQPRVLCRLPLPFRYGKSRAPYALHYNNLGRRVCHLRMDSPRLLASSDGNGTGFTIKSPAPDEPIAPGLNEL